MILHGLAALLGQIIGTSLSPEVWLAVAAVIYFGRTPRRFVVSYFAALLVLTAVRAVLFAALGGSITARAIGAGAIALLLWASIGYSIRAWRRRRRLA